MLTLDSQNESGEKPTKEEYAVGKFLRFNIPIKEGKLMGMTVQYFKGKYLVEVIHFVPETYY